MTSAQEWRPIALDRLPPGHTAWQLGPDDGAPVIRIDGLDGQLSVTGYGTSKAAAVGNARAKLKMLGGLLPERQPPEGTAHDQGA